MIQIPYLQIGSNQEITLKPGSYHLMLIGLKKQLKDIFGEHAMSIFIQQPSLFVLEQRLKNRRTETPDQIKMRLDKANEELSHADKFDYVLLNDNLEKACAEIKVQIEGFIK